MAAASAPLHAMYTWRAPVAEASARFGIPVTWIERVIKVESGGRTVLNGRPIRSRVGAMGLMQLMPGTWRAMQRAHGLGTDPDNPRDNILAGTAYLRAMYDQFGYPGLFAAYNAGPARYAEHLAGRRRLPSETIAYLATLTRGGATVIRPAGAIWSDPLPLFVAGPVVGQSAMLPDKEESPGVFFTLRAEEKR